MLIQCSVFVLLCYSAYSIPRSPDVKTSKRAIGDECGWDNIKDSFDSVPIEDTTYYANYGEFPWMVAIMKYRNNTDVWSYDDYIGGGSIIHESVVMTAAHKVINKKAEELKCRAGEWDTQTEKEKYPFQERMVKTIVTHRDLFIKSTYNDVALLFLKERFDLTSNPHIGIACLMKQAPTPSSSTNCYTMGWGKFNVTGEYSQKLKNLPMSLVSAEDCQKKLRKTRLGRYFVLHESLICAVGEKDSCHYDGGSSLVCRIKETDDDPIRTRYAVVGMVAYGLGCDVKDRPGVYVNIPNVYSWISETMNGNKYGTTTFEYSVTKDD